MPGERQCLFGVAGRLVEAPGAEVDHSCAQNNERRSGVILATAELLDGTRDQWERLVRPACGRQGAEQGAAGRGDRGSQHGPSSRRVAGAHVGAGR